MKDSYLQLLLNFGRFLPIFYFSLALVMGGLLLAVRSGKIKRESDFTLIPLFFFYLFLCTVSSSSLILPILNPQWEMSHVYCDFLAAKLFLLTSSLSVVYMYEIGIVKSISTIYYSFGILVLVTLFFDFWGYVYSIEKSLNVVQYLSMAIGTFFIIMLLYLLTKEDKNSPFFRSKSQIIESMTVILYIVTLNFFYILYVVTPSGRFFIQIVLLIMIFHIVLSIRLFSGKSKYMRKLDVAATPCSLPSLSDSSEAFATSSAIKDRLLLLFENNKPFLSPDLCIEEVAAQLFTNKSYLSKVINIDLNRNFRDFVNYYRVKEAMKFYIDNQNLSSRELCTLCGFRNNASFTNAFKLHTGRTPAEWCRDIKMEMGYGQKGNSA